MSDWMLNLRDSPRIEQKSPQRASVSPPKLPIRPYENNNNILSYNTDFIEQIAKQQKEALLLEDKKRRLEFSRSISPTMNQSI